MSEFWESVGNWVTESISLDDNHHTMSVSTNLGEGKFWIQTPY